MPVSIKSPRKLIEVALPLDAINEAAAQEKTIRHGHPSSLHLWWARRPLAAARAVLFAQLVNDPGTNIGRGFKYGKNKKEAAQERKRLFKIIEEIVKWENTTNEEVLECARAEIRRSWREVCELNKEHPQAATLFNPDKLPAFHDPFAGGGAIPLEAQRLGLEAHASDLNPVAVLINKAMIEIPPKFAGRRPVCLAARKAKDANGHLGLDENWPGATGLAEDVRYYGAWMRIAAEKRIGHLYPPIEITAEMAKDRPDLKPLVGQKLTVIAWLWARTVKSPNPAFSHVDVPLASSFVLSRKEGKEAYVHPVVKGDRYHFTLRRGAPPPEAENGTKAAGRGANFRCIVSDAVIDGRYIKDQAQAGRMSQRLMGVVAEGVRGRVYLAPAAEPEALATTAKPTWKPDVEFFQEALGFRVGNYRLYFYSVRYLLERVSWFCRDHRPPHDTGDGSAEIVFSNRSGMSYVDLREYMAKLKRQSQVQDGVSIEWAVINPDEITSYTAGKRMGLQIADAVASSFFYAVQPSQYGYVEGRYARMLKPVVYHRGGRYPGYGLKFWPREADATWQNDKRLDWLEDYTKIDAGSGTQDPTH